MRKYDKGLVAKIREKQYVKPVDGIDILMKPVPDAEREHALDPRLKAVIEQKAKMFKDRAVSGWKLSNERFRPDKVTYDITDEPVCVDEFLIDVNGDHKIDVFSYKTESAQHDCPVLVYLHGGGFTAGDMRLFACQMKRIAEQSGAVVLFPEYRLAPECPYPGPIEDAFATVEWAYAHATELGADPQKLMVAGDSAGGALSAACVYKDEAGHIKRLMGIYPAYDMRRPCDQDEYEWGYGAYDVVDDERELVFGRIDRIKCGMDEEDAATASLYLQGKTAVDDPLVSALCSSDDVLSRYPETVIVSAEYDYLRIGSDQMAKRLASLGVPVRSIRYLGCDHGFLDMMGTIVQSEELCLTIADELRAMA